MSQNRKHRSQNSARTAKIYNDSPSRSCPCFIRSILSSRPPISSAPGASPASSPLISRPSTLAAKWNIACSASIAWLVKPWSSPSYDLRVLSPPGRSPYASKSCFEHLSLSTRSPVPCSRSRGRGENVCTLEVSEVCGATQAMPRIRSSWLAAVNAGALPKDQQTRRNSVAANRPFKKLTAASTSSVQYFVEDGSR